MRTYCLFFTMCVSWKPALLYLVLYSKKGIVFSWYTFFGTPNEHFSNISYEPLIQNLLYFTIKFDVLLIYAFSQTVLVLFYVFSVIGGFCAGDLSTVFLSLFASYISGSSLLLMIVCDTKSAMVWLEKLVFREPQKR